MAKSITEPTAEQQVIELYNRGMREFDRVNIVPDAKYVIAFLRVNKNVGETEYADLITQIEALTGIRSCRFIIDHTTRVDLPAGHELRAFVELHIRVDPTQGA